MRTLFILLFNLIYFNNLYSQSIFKGKVVDESNEPLIGINVFLSSYPINRNKRNLII